MKLSALSYLKPWSVGAMLCSLITFFPNDSYSNEPRFDGVHAELRSGEFIQLEELQTNQVILAGRPDDEELIEGGRFSVFVRRAYLRPFPPQDFMLCMGVRGVELAQIAELEPLDLSRIVSIVIRAPGSSYEVDGVAELTTLVGLQNALRLRQGNDVVQKSGINSLNPPRCQGRPGVHLNPGDGRPDLVVNEWGWWDVKRQTVNDLVTRFFPQGSLRSDFKYAADFEGVRGGDAPLPYWGPIVRTRENGKTKFYFLGR